jgi:hypothetical protein
LDEGECNTFILSAQRDGELLIPSLCPKKYEQLPPQKIAFTNRT